jgi:hypothetical protein
MAAQSARLMGVIRNAAYLSLLVALAIVLVWQAVAARRTAERTEISEAAATATTGQTDELSCDTVAHGQPLGVLPEASGLALSLRTPGVIWSLNDSSAPVVIALNPSGQVLGTVRITGADVSNWEDVSVAPCGTGSCLYVADVGNGGGTQRNDVVIYRVPEPTPTDKSTAPAEVFNAAYPENEDHEAEAIFVADGQLYLVTKGHPSRMFRFPRTMPAGSLVTLERVGQVPTERFLKDTISRQTRITDAETSPDGKWVAMRTNKALLLYRTRDVIAGNLNNLWHADLSSLDETQGEGVAMSDAGDVYLASEGGGKGLPGTFAHIRCALPK